MKQNIWYISNEICTVLVIHTDLSRQGLQSRSFKFKRVQPDFKKRAVSRIHQTYRSIDAPKRVKL